MPDEEPKLTPAQRRAYIRNQIPLKTWYNTTGKEVLKALQDRGYGIASQDFYAIRRDKIAASDLEQAFKQLGPNDTIPVSYAQSKPDWDLSSKYLFQFKIVGREPGTNNKKVGFFALASDTTLGKQEAIDALGSLMEGRDTFYEITPEEFSLYEMYSKE